MAFAPDTLDDGFEVAENFESATKIMVFGVGGGGGNAVENMVNSEINDVEYVVANTDVAALRSKDGTKMKRIQIGRKTTRGQGAGNNPEVGRASAEENSDDIAARLENVSMLFVAAGMGGGTGTGAAPVVSKLAKEKGILTVGVVTKPFDFEGDNKMQEAVKGVAEMKKNVDALIVIPNDRVRALKSVMANGGKLTFKESFKKVDEILCKAVMGIIKLLRGEGYINIDFADIKMALENSGIAHMAMGSGKGENKVEDAIKEVVNSPLLETSIAGARRGLINVSLPEDVLLDEVDSLMREITEKFNKNARYKCGVVFDPELDKDEIAIIAVATDFIEEDPVPQVSISVGADEKVTVETNESADTVSKPFSEQLFEARENREIRETPGFERTSDVDTLLRKFTQSKDNL